MLGWEVAVRTVIRPAELVCAQGEAPVAGALSLVRLRGERYDSRSRQCLGETGEHHKVGV